MAVQVKFGLLQDAVKVKSASGTIINPATEEALQQIFLKLAQEVSETPSGTPDGVRKIFGTSYVFRTGSTKLYLNGVRQREGPGNDYVEDLGRNSVTFVVAPLSLDVLLIDYLKG